MIRRSLPLSFCALCVFCGPSSYANPPVASYIFPAGGQRGQTVEVRVGGLFLHEKCSFEMLGPGLTAGRELKRTQTLWLEGPLLPLPDSQQPEDYPRDMAGKVRIAADAPLGIRHWRVGTAQGVTPARRFVVGELPEVVEKEVPGAPVSVPVTLPVTVNGRVFPYEDVDIWSFPARKGQTVTCAVEAARLGSPLDARIEVLDPSGRSLAENDDALAADSFVRFTAPADGVYRVRIHDINFKGGQAYVYRLTLTAGPHVDRAYPLGGRRGTRVPFTLSGQGLPPGPVLIDLPAGGPGAYAHPVEVAGQRANPVLLDLDDLPELLEDDRAGAAGQRVTTPAVANGRIARPGEADRWRFAARKGEALAIELRAQRLGSPLVGTLSVLDDKGKVLARAQGSAAQADPSLVFTAPADGAYAVQVESLFRSQGGPECAYRLRLAPPVPDFRLRLAADALGLDRGGQASLKVFIDRSGDFKEPVALKLEGLPADVTAPAITAAPGQAAVDIPLKAGPTAQVRVFTMSVRGTAKVAGRELTRTAVLPGERGVPDLDAVRVAVCVPTPFKVVGTYQMGWAARGTIGRRKYRIERNGFTGPLRVRLADRQARHLQGATGPTIVVPAGATEFEYPVTLPPWMEIGRTCRVCVMAVGVLKDPDGTEHTVSFSSVGQNEQYVAVIEAGRLSVALERPSLRAEAGKAVEVPLCVKRGKGLEGPVRVELIVPQHIRGVSAGQVVIPAGRDGGALMLRFAAGERGPFNMPLTVRATLDADRGPVVAETKLEVGAGP